MFFTAAAVRILLEVAAAIIAAAILTALFARIPPERVGADTHCPGPVRGEILLAGLE